MLQLVSLELSLLSFLSCRCHDLFKAKSSTLWQAAWCTLFLLTMENLESNLWLLCCMHCFEKKLMSPFSLILLNFYQALLFVCFIVQPCHVQFIIPKKMLFSIWWGDFFLQESSVRDWKSCIVFVRDSCTWKFCIYDLCQQVFFFWPYCSVSNCSSNANLCRYTMLSQPYIVLMSCKMIVWKHPNDF